jgi:hypothetical protein
VTSVGGANNYGEKDDNSKPNLYQFQAIGKRAVEDVPENNVGYYQQNHAPQYKFTNQPAYITGPVQDSLNTIERFPQRDIPPILLVVLGRQF